MLNELHRVVVALERRKVPLVIPHSAFDSMGKNSDLLLVRIDSHGSPCGIALLPGEVAGKLGRVCHGSEGSSFPGFNLPLPLRKLRANTPIEILQRLVDVQKRKGSSANEIMSAVRDTYPHTDPIDASDPEDGKTEKRDGKNEQFLRSVRHLVGWLQVDFATGGPALSGFRRLLDAVAESKLELPNFCEAVANLIRHTNGDWTRSDAIALAEIVFGKTHIQKLKEPIGSPAFWHAKSKADNKLSTPVYLDIIDTDLEAPPVADSRTARAINQHLLSIKPLPYAATARCTAPKKAHRKKAERHANVPPRDAFSGDECVVVSSFPSPKLAVLGSTKLFSNNTGEAACFYRYGLGDTATFKVSADLVEKMSGALFTLAGDDSALVALGGRACLGRTCRSIPDSRGKKSDLLIAYLEEEPDAPDPYVELFGSSDDAAPDFSASTKQLLDALSFRNDSAPNQLIRVIVLAAVDTANSQVSLNRSFAVRDVVEATTNWKRGAENCPPVTLPFVDKETKKRVTHCHTTPRPLEIARVLNEVRSPGSDRPEFRRIMTASDAYDIFLAPSPVREAKTGFALRALLDRTTDLCAAAGRLKATSRFDDLGEASRWQVLKSVALIGIFLNQLQQQHESFMKDSIYQVGRILALADSLHVQYCKWVRTSDEKRKQGKIDCPSELLGNSLFNFALDNPVAALARLAERIRPYKGWADSYSGEDAGLVHWFGRQMAESESLLDVATLPTRMEDIHKAQLLLGYLADHPKSKSE